MNWGLAALAAIVAWPVFKESQRKPVKAIRDQAPGQFAALSRGQTHYHWSGPEDGEVVVLVHGLTTPSFVWQSLIPILTAKGYPVLAYDHYGRGYSDRPRDAQDEAFFTSHLRELLTDLRIEQPITLIGYSMGGAVAAAFAAAHPEKVKQTILIAPAGMGHDLGMIAKITQYTPLIGDWLMLAFFPKSHRQGCEAERASVTSTVDNVFDLQIAEQDTRGFFRSVLSSLRGILAMVLETQHRKIASSGIPVTAIWGRDDTIIPITRKDVLAGWNPDASNIVIEGAGHGLTYTHTDQVGAAILGRL